MDVRVVLKRCQFFTLILKRYIGNATQASFIRGYGILISQCSYAGKIKFFDAGMCFEIIGVYILIEVRIIFLSYLYDGNLLRALRLVQLYDSR